MVLEKTFAFVPTLQDVVEPGTGHAGELAAEKVTIGATVTDRKVDLGNRDVLDRFVVNISILESDILFASNDVNSRAVDGQDIEPAGIRHSHRAHAGVQHDKGFDARVAGQVHGLGAAAGHTHGCDLIHVYNTVIFALLIPGLVADPIQPFVHQIRLGGSP